jgi:hypothetical protein
LLRKEVILVSELRAEREEIEDAIRSLELFEAHRTGTARSAAGTIIEIRTNSKRDDKSWIRTRKGTIKKEAK